MKSKNNWLDNSLLSSDIPEHIHGISCNVKNCAYHDGDSLCTASHITIGPSYASACTDTICATFKQNTLRHT